MSAQPRSLDVIMAAFRESVHNGRPVALTSEEVQKVWTEISDLRRVESAAKTMIKYKDSARLTVEALGESISHAAERRAEA